MSEERLRTNLYKIGCPKSTTTKLLILLRRTGLKNKRDVENWYEAVQRTSPYRWPRGYGDAMNTWLGKALNIYPSHVSSEVINTQKAKIFDSINTALDITENTVTYDISYKGSKFEVLYNLKNGVCVVNKI